ncbi:hypothetical protein [Bryobacter aggregatus]|uniref:hypothetical protein n=1 Tax=Bryobacter aggregatus TaxID=360054 RepID=UPI0004E157FD|nr:hypothetical protein [Bryobacter aggregatus]
MTRTTILQVILGLDLGQTQDPTAAALLLDMEQTVSPYSWIDSTHRTTRRWQLASTRLWPLETAYTQVAIDLKRICRRIQRQYPATPLILLCDATGIGRPTLEMIHKELQSPGEASPARIEGIVFTGGATVSESRHPALPVNLFHVPRLDLIQTLLQAIESRQLQAAPGLEDAARLATQLKSLRYTESRSTGQTGIEVHKSAAHPETANADLVMALAMATWRMKTLAPSSSKPPNRLPGF